jgi:hypothetical protein
VDSGAGSSAGSSASLNGPTRSSKIEEQQTGSTLINLNVQVENSGPGTDSANGSPSSSDSAFASKSSTNILDKGVTDIHITENPISEVGLNGGTTLLANPTC